MGAMKSVYRKPPTSATAEYQINGNVGAFIPAGSLLNRSDGYQYRTDTDVTIGSTGTETIAITAVLSDIAIDVTGGGSAGNSPVGTALTLDRSFSGVVSTNIMSTPATGGADLESEESFRARILSAFQNPHRVAVMLITKNGRWMCLVLRGCGCDVERWDPVRWGFTSCVTGMIKPIMVFLLALTAFPVLKTGGV